MRILGKSIAVERRLMMHLTEIKAIVRMVARKFKGETFLCNRYYR